jgi:hypothetical protein
MRRLPDLQVVERAIYQLPQSERRLQVLRRAGQIYQYPPFVFQVCGVTPAIAAEVLHRLTDRGYVPEPLRIAHLIGAAVVRGESGRQA